MARPKGRPKAEQRHDKTVRIDARVLGMAEMVARTRGVTLAEYLTGLVREPVAKDFAKVMKQVEGGQLP